MWERILFWVGISIQLFGVGLTIIGAVWVWQDVRRSGDRFMGPLIEAWLWLVRGLRRLLRRPAPQVISIGGGAAIGVAGSANAYTSPGSLPDGLSVDDRIALVHEQLRKNIDKIYTRMFKIQSDLHEEIKQEKSERKLAVEAANARDEENRKRAVDERREPPAEPARRQHHHARPQMRHPRSRRPQSQDQFTSS